MSELTEREKEMLAALKIARDGLAAHALCLPRSVMEAVDAVIAKAEPPKPHVFEQLDEHWGQETCSVCGKPSWDPIHVKSKPRRFLVEIINADRAASLDGLRLKPTDNWRPDMNVIREVKPITQTLVEKAWYDGAIGHRSPLIDVIRFLNKLSIEVEG